MTIDEAKDEILQRLSDKYTEKLAKTAWEPHASTGGFHLYINLPKVVISASVQAHQIVLKPRRKGVAWEKYW
jgi:hypothetical protein